MRRDEEVLGVRLREVLKGCEVCVLQSVGLAGWEVAPCGIEVRGQVCGAEGYVREGGGPGCHLGLQIRIGANQGWMELTGGSSQFKNQVNGLGQFSCHFKVTRCFVNMGGVYF